ncbi:hypothetical protein DFI02_104220 [Rhizobium sp. PP-F2F-G20b]|nr:hypothetical protein C8J32_10686 [Rhizobium sp. PP-CC-3A-592]PYE43514.1 hypothetical protein DFI02_104220 [Rhizobium sp. PP-F2F-G20b]
MPQWLRWSLCSSLPVWGMTYAEFLAETVPHSVEFPRRANMLDRVS